MQPIEAASRSLLGFERMRSRVLWFTGAFVAALVVIQGGAYWARYDAAIAAAERRGANLALILKEHIEQTVAAADAALRQIVTQNRRLGGPAAAAGEWPVLLDAAHSGVSGVGSISILDAAGVIRHSTIAGIVGQSRASTFLVRALRDTAASGIVADRPFRGSVSGRILMPVGRRLQDPSGAFQGAVVATIELGLLREFYRSVAEGSGGVVRVLHPSGVIFFSEPSRTEAAGAAAADDAVLAAHRGGKRTGIVAAPLERGGDAYITAYQATDAPELVVAVSLRRADVLEAWFQDLAVGAAVTALFGAALLFAALQMRRQLAARATAEREQRAAEERLRQSQKLEAVGQLTGGVAHDFNNLLTVMLGGADLLAERLAHDPALKRQAEVIVGAAQRGAELTQRLLAFARRQPLAAEAVDVNRLLSGIDGMLRRSLGEHIEIELVRGAGLWSALADRAQIETTILNLAINARDAMPDGGRLTIETANAHIDHAYADAHADVTPGQYVMIAVGDTGTGMPPEVAARAFEPFFTTKPVGKGTGLGLSMVYGFVRQSDGHVKIYSEPGKGTTMKLYLPRAASDAASAAPPAAPRVARGHERVFVVEDDAGVREHAERLLRELGYDVTTAASGPEALDLFRRGERFDLLFTDVVMPRGLNGRELADAARQIQPGLAVLFTSGYTENVVIHHGHLDHGVALLQKPYRREALAARIRAALDAGRRPA